MEHQKNKIKVLLIDDDEDFRELVHDFLLSDGYEVFTATEGKTGLAILRREKVDILLTDIIMPGKEGIETIMEVVENYPAIKIIAMSGASSNDIYLKMAHEFGADRILTKPFKKQDLLSAMEAVTV